MKKLTLSDSLKKRPQSYRKPETPKSMNFKDLKSYEPTPSKVLLAIGLTPEQALSTIRISLDEFNTLSEIDETAKIIIKLVERIRTNEQ